MEYLSWGQGISLLWKQVGGDDVAQVLKDNGGGKGVAPVHAQVPQETS